MCWRIILVGVLLIFQLTACTTPLRSTSPQSGPVDVDPGKQIGTLWFTTYNVEQPVWIRAGLDRAPVVSGEQFEVSSDGELVAIRTGRTLAIWNPSTNTSRTVSTKAEAFRWRPGTRDLLYLVRGPRSGFYGELYLHREDGTATRVEEGPFESLITARVSPDGNWLAYQLAMDFGIVSLTDFTTTTLSSQTGDSVGWPIWADSNSLSVIEGDGRLVLVSIPSGERRAYADVQFATPLGTSLLWSRDGHSVAVPGKDWTVILRNQQIAAKCQGKLIPLGWSPNDRFLALRDEADRLRILDLQQEEVNCEAMVIPAVVSLEDWHPDSSAMVVATKQKLERGTDLEVWKLADEGISLLHRLGKGSNARWVRP